MSDKVEHYNKEETETVVIQEKICRLLEEAGIPAAKIHFIATAIKYQSRAGKKTGESLDKDLHKEADYICRALTGQWLYERKHIIDMMKRIEDDLR